MTHEDILHNSSIIIQEFDREFEKVDKELMLREINEAFRKGGRTDVRGVEIVLYDYQTTFPQYQKLVSILGKLFVNWDDVLDCFPMAHHVFAKEIPKEWVIQQGVNVLNSENYIIHRLGGKPKNLHVYPRDNPINIGGW